MKKKSLGKLGESLAAQHLRSKGYRVLEKNFTSRFGEIDLIAQEKDDLVFIEVKTTRGNLFGQPEEAVTPRKISHLKKAAWHYQETHPRLPPGLRIDVVAITLDKEGKLKVIKLFKNITQ